MVRSSFKQWLLAMVQADEEDWVWTAVGNRGGQGDDAQPDRGLPHGPLSALSPAAAPAQHPGRWHKPGNSQLHWASLTAGLLFLLRFVQTLMTSNHSY